MRRGWIAGVLTALVLGGLVAVTAALAASQADGDQVAASAANRQAGETTATTTPPDTDDLDEADGEDAGSGPPPWAHSNKAAAMGHGKNAEWKEAWRQLTPAERARKMTKLANTHAAGMRTWKNCVDAAADDKTKRAACEKPLPPGLAKKQQR